MADAEKGGNALLNSIAHPTIVNPLAAYKDAASVANSIWTNREWQARQAAGEAQQGAIDPTTGVYDPNQAGRLLSGAGPTAALAAGPTLESSQRLSDQQLAQAQKKVGWVNAAAGAALQSGDYSDSAMLKLFQDGMANNLLTLPEVQKQMATLPPDAAGRQRWLQQHQMTAASTQQQLDQTYGTRPEVHTGGDIQFPVVPPASAGGKGPVITTTTTPGERIAPVTGPATATGAPTTQPAADYARSHGIDPVTGQPIPNPAFRNLPPGLRNPNAPPPVSAPTQTGAGPAATSAMSAGGTASSGSYQAVSDAGNKAVSQRALLQGMAADATQFTTGWGADRIKTMKSAVQRIGGMFGLSPVDADKLAANEDLDKVAAQLSDAQGAGSDARLAVNQGANPSSHNSPAGLKLILNKLIGNADYNAAKSQMAAAYQRTQDPTGANARQFEADFRDRFDPRVFQFNRMDGDQQRQYLKELGAGKEKFKLDYIKTKQAGVFPGG